MAHVAQFDTWNARIQDLFAQLKPHHRTALAQYSFGMALARCCGLSSVVTYLAGLLGLSALALTQRLREFYRPATAQRGSARTEFDYTLCFAPLVRWAAGSHPAKRMVLALDPSCLTDRFRVLCAAVLYQGHALPVAWVVQTASQTGKWNPIWIDLLTKLHAALGTDYEVLVLTDRGLESAELFRAITSLGWHPLMRVKANSGKFTPAGWTGRYHMHKFAPTVGCKYASTGVAYPTTAKLTCTLLASFDPEHHEPHLALTDLEPENANVVWYGWRMWIEQGFRTIKRGQWQWQRTQMTDPMRAARLWAVMAVATVWLIEIGQQAEAAQVPEIVQVRLLSLLKQGLAYLSIALMTGKPLPQGTLTHHNWPAGDPQTVTLSEAQMNAC